MKSVKFFAQNGERQYARAQRIWQVLTGYVMFKQDVSEKGECLITYGDLADVLGYDRRAGVTLGGPLGYIHRFCEENDLPHLNAVVVREDTGIAGWDDMFPDRTRHLKEQERVKEFDWFTVRTPTAGTLKKYSAGELYSET